MTRAITLVGFHKGGHLGGRMNGRSPCHTVAGHGRLAPHPLEARRGGLAGVRVTSMLVKVPHM